MCAAVPLAAVQTLTLNMSFFFFLFSSRQWGRGSVGGVYHALELPASQLVCLTPRLRPERLGEGGKEYCIFLSFIPSLSTSFFKFPPSSTLTFIFLVFACPLKAKGLRALYVNVCVWPPGCIWRLHQPVAFSQHVNSSSHCCSFTT